MKSATKKQRTRWNSHWPSAETLPSCHPGQVTAQALPSYPFEPKPLSRIYSAYGGVKSSYPQQSFFTQSGFDGFCLANLTPKQLRVFIFQATAGSPLFLPCPTLAQFSWCQRVPRLASAIWGVCQVLPCLTTNKLQSD